MAMAPEDATERANRARFCNQAMDMYIEHLVASYCTHSYHLFNFIGYMRSHSSVNVANWHVPQRTDSFHESHGGTQFEGK